MSDERNPSQQSMRCALAEVMPTDHPALHFAHAAHDHRMHIQLFSEVQQNFPMLPSLGTNDRNVINVDNPNFIPQRGSSTALLLVDTFSDAPPFLSLNHHDDNGTITNHDIPITAGHPPTIAAQNPPQQVHHQNELVDSIPGRPTHASAMANERWGLYQQPDDPTNIPMHLLRQLPVRSIPRV